MFDASFFGHISLYSYYNRVAKKQVIGSCHVKWLCMSTYLVVTSTFWNHVSDLSHFVLPFFKERLKQKRFSDASRISRRGVLLLLCPALSTFFILNMMSWDAKWSASFDALLVMVLVGSWFILQKYFLYEDISCMKSTLCKCLPSSSSSRSMDILFISDTFQNPSGVFGATNSPKCPFAKKCR